MSRLFTRTLGISSSESDDEESSCKVQNLSSTTSEQKTPDVTALIKELQDVLKAESAAVSAEETEASSSLENNEPKEDATKENNFVSKPDITKVKERKLEALKNWSRIDVTKSEKFNYLKKRYFEELNDFINKWRLEERGLVLNPINESNLPYVFEDIMSAICAELNKTDKEPILLLKALYYFFSKFPSLVTENASLKAKCILSLKKFITSSSKCKALEYLFKDMAVDILSELGGITLTTAAGKLLTCNFRYLQEFREELYKTTISWLCNVTPETAVKLLHSETEFSDTLTLRALNSPKILRRLILVCESNVCCLPDELKNLSRSEGINMPNQSKDVSQMETSVLTESEKVSSVIRKPFYDRNSLKNLNDLIRHETIYTPISYFEYNPKLTRRCNFLDQMFEEKRMRQLSSEPKKYLHTFAKRESQTASVRAEDLGLAEASRNSDCPQKFFVTEHDKSFITDQKFWDSWDIFSNVETVVDVQRAFYGGLSALQLDFDLLEREKAKTRQVSVDISDIDPRNIKASPNIFDSFKMPDSFAELQKKPTTKR